MVRLLALLSLVVVAAGCDSGTDGPPPLGQFTAQVSGEIERDLSGDAAFSYLDVGPERSPVLSITLIDRRTLRQSVGLSDVNGVLEGEGTYGLGIDRDGLSLLLSVDESGVRTTYAATDGTLEITDLGDDQIVGAFSAQLAPFPGDFDLTPTARVEGTFEAVSVESVSRD